MSFLKPSLALAAPNPVPDVDGLPGWTGNLTLALLLAVMVEESTYRASCMIRGSQWVNSIIGAPVVAPGT